MGSYYYATMSGGLQVKAEYVVDFFSDYRTEIPTCTRTPTPY